MDKTQLVEAEKLLQKLLDELSLTIPQIEELLKKLQKANSANIKKIEEAKKDLLDYIENKGEIKEFLEKKESNQLTLMKAAQKIISKSKSNQTPETNGKKKEKKIQYSGYNIETDNMIDMFNKEGGKKCNCDNLYIYFEMLSKFKTESVVPFFTMIYLPKEKKINLYLAHKGILNLSFAQVDYLCDTKNQLFLNIDYFSMLEKCEIEKSREYKENCLNMAQFENYMKQIPLLKENETKVIYIDGDCCLFKKEIKAYCQSVKDKIKNVVTNNKDFFVETVI